MGIVRLLKKAVSILVTAVLAIALACNVYVIASRAVTGDLQPDVFGWSWAVVISGSMAPEINVNDLIVIHEEDTYAPGDVITYRSGHSLVTHRIVEETDTGYITRGDANNTADSAPVYPVNVVGEVAAVIPKVGLFIEFMRTPLGMLGMVLVGFAIIEIPWLLEKGRWEKGGKGE